MNELRELYQELIMDHGRHPRNFKTLPNATVSHDGYNPLCGDRVTLFLKIDNDRIVDACFQGGGCAISMASASMMTDTLKGKTTTEAKILFSLFQQLVMGSAVDSAEESLGKLAVLKGVSEFPARVKCATLAWHTMTEAILQR